MVPGPTRQVSTFQRIEGSRFGGTIWGALAEFDEARRVLRVDGAESSAWETSAEPEVASTATVYFPIEGAYRRYPVRVYMYRKQKDEGSRAVGESPFAFVRGRVPVKGRTILVEFQFDYRRRNSYLDEGWQGMDLNGDGAIDRHPRSTEWLYANDERPVFRSGDLHLSAKSIDLAKREIVLRLQGADAYRRIDLTPGNVIPDFAFTDFTRRARRLSEIEARYVLLDFWAVWCGPCIADWKRVKPVYEKFRAKGFEVLGLHPDSDHEKALKLTSEVKLPWILARGESVRDLVERQFRIVAYPQYVLIDRQRRIVSASDELRGEALEATLEKLFH